MSHKFEFEYIFMGNLTLTVEASYSPAKPQSMEEPVCDEEIEITSVRGYGNYLKTDDIHVTYIGPVVVRLDELLKEAALEHLVNG